MEFPARRMVASGKDACRLRKFVECRLETVAFAELHILDVGDETPGQAVVVACVDGKAWLVAIDVVVALERADDSAVVRAVVPQSDRARVNRTPVAVEGSVNAVASPGALPGNALADCAVIINGTAMQAPRTMASHFRVAASFGVVGIMRLCVRISSLIVQLRCELQIQRSGRVWNGRTG